MSEKGAAPPAGVTPEVFEAWRSPRDGSANPERMNNPLWEWLIECRLSAYQANEILNGPSPFDAGPMWCFDRFGQSVSRLPDGRQVLIAGEHEDHYDPDFHIYNDLVIIDESGKAEIYGYPREVFPPTDFHSASVTDAQIVLIGSLGYRQDRCLGETQVVTVERESWAISRIDTVGPSPGWIHNHKAEVRNDRAAILITGGKLFRGDGASLIENIDDWLLYFDGWRWERLTERRWTRFEVYGEERRHNHLWNLRQVLWHRKMGWHDFDASERKLETELGMPLRLEVVPLLYRPPIAHEVMPEQENEYNIYRIRVDGVVVRYVEDRFTVQMTIEGELQPEAVEQLREDLVQKLETVEQSPMVCEAIA